MCLHTLHSICLTQSLLTHARTAVHEMRMTLTNVALGKWRTEYDLEAFLKYQIAFAFAVKGNTVQVVDDFLNFFQLWHHCKMLLHFSQESCHRSHTCIGRLFFFSFRLSHTCPDTHTPSQAPDAKSEALFTQGPMNIIIWRCSGEI